jgi:hypothetical protein
MSPQPTPQKQPAARPRKGGGCLVPLVVLLLVAAAIGFLVWKFVLGPQTYTDPDYGYSFAHPARWEVIGNDSLASRFGYLTDLARTADMVVVGKSLDSEDPDQGALVAVARTEVSPTTDGSTIPAQMQSDLYRAVNGGLTLSVVEAAHTVTVGGIDAWKMTVSITDGSYSITMAYCVLLSGDARYALIGAAAGDAWNADREAFDRFFDSFNPG